jgi:hypothetical protein
MVYRFGEFILAKVLTFTMSQPSYLIFYYLKKVFLNLEKMYSTKTIRCHNDCCLKLTQNLLKSSSFNVINLISENELKISRFNEPYFIIEGKNSY